jgi:hypothetical protein
MFAALLPVVAGTLLSFSEQAAAGPPDDAFYHQLLKLPAPSAYTPTRTFTIVTDAEHGDQLVAEDDPNLRFNLLWMEQFQPGYKVRRGGAAFGQIFRSYIRSAYKAYRDSHAEALSALPDENGNIQVHTFSNEMDYHLDWNGSDVKFGVNYSF